MKAAEPPPPALQLAWAGAGRVAAVATELADCLGGLTDGDGSGAREEVVDGEGCSRGDKARR